MTTAELKHTLRALRRLECKIRGIQPCEFQSADLIWTEFFSTADDAHVRYPLSTLSVLDRPGRKRVVDEYLESVVYQTLSPGGPRSKRPVSSRLLDFLGLPVTASSSEMTRRFRELAQELHPDHGGDTDLMSELLDLYRGVD